MTVHLRFISTGDLQVHPFKQFSKTRSSGMNSRLHNCLRIFDLIIDAVQKTGVKKVLLNGDILESTNEIEVQTYDALYSKLERLKKNGIDIVINMGNHDICKAAGKRILHSLRPFRQVATVIEKPTLVWDYLWVIPWMQKPKEFKRAIQKLPASKRFALALHCGVQGATTGPSAYLVRNPIKLKDIRHEKFGIVLLSDYHTRQWLAYNALYMGSPLQHSFGETHNPCLWDVSLLDSKPWFKLEKIYTNMPRFKRVYVQKLADLTNVLDKFRGHYVRVLLVRGTRVSPEDIEQAVAGQFLYELEYEKEETERGIDKTVALQPEAAMMQFVGTQMKADSKRARKLLALGHEIYAGEC